MCARTRGYDHIAFDGFKDPDGVFGDLARIHSKSSVERGLTATSLVARKVHIRTRASQHIHHRFTDFRKKAVNQTGNEELSCSHGFIVFQKPVV